MAGLLGPSRHARPRRDSQYCSSREAGRETGTRCSRRRRMIDFSTSYLGLKLNGPIVVSSTPLSESTDNVCRMEESGASAIVLTSLFEEQLMLESQALDDYLSRD